MKVVSDSSAPQPVCAGDVPVGLCFEYERTLCMRVTSSRDDEGVIRCVNLFDGRVGYLDATEPVIVRSDAYVHVRTATSTQPVQPAQPSPDQAGPSTLDTQA